MQGTQKTLGLAEAQKNRLLTSTVAPKIKSTFFQKFISTSKSRRWHEIIQERIWEKNKRASKSKALVIQFIHLGFI